ncbi:pantetheine-phosphate adenylyltransferase [bacterium]|nr:MAG: pantetheine-phosphate adenylyltransferase [bacterium]RKZ16380.1 MAG: pantetheine-phosphate adenylyltransferase [bacterium]
MNTALYPGTFDPVHNGHIDLLRRASRTFDRIIVGVARSQTKGALFPLEDRLEMAREATAHLPAVEVKSFKGLLVNAFAEMEADVVIRGVRLFQDFEYEYQMALMNRRLSPEFDVMFLMPSADFLSVSSTLIKDIHRHGGDVSALVPACVTQRLGPAPQEEG